MRGRLARPVLRGLRRGNAPELPAHAPPTGPARTVAALPPTALVVTEVVLMVIVRRAARYRILRLTGDAQHSYQQLKPAGSAQLTTGRDLHAEARQLIAIWQADGLQITGADLARQLGTSARHGRRLLAAYRAGIGANSNGRQPERPINARDRAGCSKRPGKPLSRVTGGTGGQPSKPIRTRPEEVMKQ